VHCELFFGYLPFVGQAFRMYLPRRPIHIKFMGARSCGVLLAGLLGAEVFVHVAV
jgi:hypothetical protein